MLETHTIPQERVAELHAERAANEAASQQLAAGQAAAPSGGAQLPAAPIELTPKAHRHTITAIVSICQVLGGQDVPGPIQEVAADLSFEAARKYGGEIPYFVEIMAFAGIGLLVKASFFPPKPQAAAPPPPAAAQVLA